MYPLVLHCSNHRFGLLSGVDIPLDGRGFGTITFKALHSYLAYMTVSSVKSGIDGSFKIKYMYSK